jgi:5-methyltetrahydrofolate--homocysteine methyltransferase
MLRRADSLPESAKERLEILEECLETAASCGISQEQLCIDPMVQAAAFLDTEEGEAPAGVMLETIRKIREKYEKLHIVGAISNISYGLPDRRYVNQSFAVLAQQAGMDCMILNPLDTELQSVLTASQMLLGLDGEPCCMGYVRSFRKNQQLKNS